MPKFNRNENVVVKFGEVQASGKVLHALDDGGYLVLYCSEHGWTTAVVDESMLTSFGDSKFMVVYSTPQE